MAATALLVVAISTVGQSGTAWTTNATGGSAQASSEWRDRIALDRLLSDSAALDKLVIIYRPTYRQTLFVFGMGKVVLQTYPPSFFPQDTAMVPTCTANKSQSDVRDVIRTMIRAHFFELPQKSYVDTGDENNEIEFEKEVKNHSIVVDDGASRAYRDFAEGQYRGKNEQIPAAFGEVEDALRRLAGPVLNGAPCPMGHYMEWRRTGRGETVRGIVGDIPGGLPPDGASPTTGLLLSSEPRSPRVASPTHIRVTPGVMRSFLITKVNPSYPLGAERQHVDGTVLLRINIDKNGNVATVEPVTGHPLLIPAAIDAVKQWKYKPYLLNQTTVEVETTVLIKFVISNGNAYSVIAFASPNPGSWR
jgi:TonB family protein